MIKSNFIVRTYFADCPLSDSPEVYCLQRDLEVESAEQAIKQAKELKSHKEFERIVVVQRADGYVDRILYEFERGN